MKISLTEKLKKKICCNKRNSRRMTAVLASPARFERATFRLGGLGYCFNGVCNIHIVNV